MPFTEGDRVAWSHSFSTVHADGSIVKEEAVTAADPAAKLGTVTGPGNDENTYWNVHFDDGEDLTLTQDEIVKVAPAEAEAAA